MNDWLRQSAVQKGIALTILVVVLYLLRNVLNILLLTFIFSFLFYSIYRLLLQKLPAWAKKSPKLWILLMYSTSIFIVGTIGYRFPSIVTHELGEIFRLISAFDIDKYTKSLPPLLVDMIKQADLKQYLNATGQQALRAMAGISSFLMQVLISMILSFFFLWEKDIILSFLRKFKHSKASFLFECYASFGQNFLNTFGKIVQLQLAISSINSVLSVLLLYLLGFPNIIGLGFMIFVLGLIPVAGVTISLIPLSVIAFQIGGFLKIVHVIIMILILHAIESYFLNPKLYSVTMKIPIFFTFMILIVSEHLFGVWGLIIGVPLFMFILDLLKVPMSGGNIPQEHPKHVKKKPLTKAEVIIQDKSTL